MRRLLEEILPFIFYLINRRKLLADADDSELIKDGGPLSSYRDLDEDTISTRIKEEHDRAKLIDEKTIKFTLTLTIALTLLSSTSTFISKAVAHGVFQSWSTALSGASAVYMLIAGLISLGALTTLPTYGYGTFFLIKSRTDKDVRVHALAAQEKVNAVRQIRNESAFQCLRNGLILLLVSFSVTLVGSFSDLGHASEQKEAKISLQQDHSKIPQNKTIPQKPKTKN